MRNITDRLSTVNSFGTLKSLEGYSSSRHPAKEHLTRLPIKMINGKRRDRTLLPADISHPDSGSDETPAARQAESKK